MSTKGAQFLHLPCQGGRLARLLVTPLLITGLLL